MIKIEFATSRSMRSSLSLSVCPETLVAAAEADDGVNVVVVVGNDAVVNEGDDDDVVVAAVEDGDVDAAVVAYEDDDDDAGECRALTMTIMMICRKMKKMMRMWLTEAEDAHTRNRFRSNC